MSHVLVVVVRNISVVVVKINNIRYMFFYLSILFFNRFNIFSYSDLTPLLVFFWVLLKANSAFLFLKYEKTTKYMAYMRNQTGLSINCNICLDDL